MIVVRSIIGVNDIIACEKTLTVSCVLFFFVKNYYLLHFSSFHDLIQSCGVRRLSVRLPVIFLSKSLVYYDANGSIANKLAHDDRQVSVHPGCAEGQGHGHVTYMIAQKSLLLPC